MLLTTTAVPALAAIDLSVEVSTPEVSPTLAMEANVRVEWSSADRADDAVLQIDVPGATATKFLPFDDRMVCETVPGSIRCTLPHAATFLSGGRVELLMPAGTHSITAKLTSTTPDPDLSNNTSTATFTVVGLPSLSVHVMQDRPEQALDPGRPATGILSVQSNSEPATGVVLRATLPEGGQFTGVTPRQSNSSARCTVAQAEIVCEVGTMTAGQYVSLQYQLLTPDRADGGVFPVVATASANEALYLPHTATSRDEVRVRRVLMVTSNADDGTGSLRQTMLDSHTFCAAEPCVIRMSGEVRPVTPLPELRGRVKIDGGSPRAILDGSLLAAGDALRYETGCEFRVHSLVIRNFNGHAIEAHQSLEDRRDLACGGTAATPFNVTNSELANNVRGVVSKSMNAHVSDNVIRDHQRAGIFIDRAYYSEIRRNVITGNGASGIFVDVSAETIPGGLPPGADIVENKIRNNGHWGVARTSRGLIGVERNEIAGNVLYGIDVDLDLDTPNVADDTGKVSNKPQLTDAYYDATRGTVIRGTIVSTSVSGSPRIDLYASSALSVWGYPEAEEWLISSYGSYAFEIVVPRDLRGKWITATNTRTAALYWLRDGQSQGRPASEHRSINGVNTSELSNAILVR
jgi:hypothetical protein